MAMVIYRYLLNLSTLSWGILCDSTIEIVALGFCFCLSFNPLLRNSLWFYLYCCTCWKILMITFQPSLEEFFVILGEAETWGTYFSFFSFNPLLRNSLWFLAIGYWWFSREVQKSVFQPSLEEFFVIRFLSSLANGILTGVLSTLSWGILCDSFSSGNTSVVYVEYFQPSLEEFFVILYISVKADGDGVYSFNPLLRNSLWFSHCLMMSSSKLSGFQPSLEEFFVIPK